MSEPRETSIDKEREAIKAEIDKLRTTINLLGRRVNGFRLKNSLEQILERAELNKKTGCLEWKGALFQNGYGKANYSNRTWSAHRIVWQLTKGDPGDLFVCHTCDNRKCININHLFLGTASDNMQDKIKKDRCPLKGKTHCKYGHSLKDAYVYQNGPRKGQRQCSQCSYRRRQL
jgi:hypothetical protein